MLGVFLSGSGVDSFTCSCCFYSFIFGYVRAALSWGPVDVQEVEALQSRAQQHASAIFSCLELDHKANISIARMLALHVSVWIFEQKLRGRRGH